MGDLGSTRVFGQHGGGGVVTIGLARRPMSDLYHGLVTGSWARVALVFTVVYLATQALFGAARLGLGAAPTLGEGGEIDPRAVAAAALTVVDGFVHWAEVVLGAGIVYAKFSLVRARVLFSKVAVVAPHEGGRALVFRMANERASHIVDAKVSAMLVRNEVQDGEVVRRAHDLALARGKSALFAHAWTAVHPIDRASPLAGETPDALAAADAEVLVNVSGYDAGLLSTVHALHVYPAGAVRWNARFREILKVLPDGRHAVDYRKFHKTVPLDDAPADRTPARRARSS